MNRKLRIDAEKAAYTAINAVMPEGAVRRALLGKQFPGRVFLIAAGKAAPRMARAALAVLAVPVTDGLVISKYGHFDEPLSGLRCFEAGHPVPDENSVLAGEAALKLTEGLREDDTVLFLLSGGGSALFEKPLIPLHELQDITNQLLACGADIVEINTIRKRLSAVKGGKFAAHCAPARVEAVILSDILGDPLDMIASGPVSPDTAKSADALAIAAKYGLRLSQEAAACLRVETPKELSNVHAQVVGSVRELCRAAGEACRSIGYETVFLTDQLDCEAREAGRFLSAVLRTHAKSGKKLAPLAFVGTDFVYGAARPDGVRTAADGSTNYLFTSVVFVGRDGKEEKNYQKSGILVSDVRFLSNTIYLTRVTSVEGGKITAEAAPDYISYKVEETRGKAVIRRGDNGSYQLILPSFLYLTSIPEHLIARLSEDTGTEVYVDGKTDEDSAYLWHAGELDTSAFDSRFTFLMDTDTPSCRSLDKAYAGADTDSSKFQYYSIDGFIVSDNIRIDSVVTQDLQFKNADHNPVVLDVTLE